MQVSKLTASRKPVFPGALSLPFKMMPQAMHSRILASILNRIFTHDLKQGELDFLLDRSVAIDVRDLGLTYRLTLGGDKLKEHRAAGACDLTVRACLYDFMSLASRQEDPDTLVFQRRLVMEGDTELGLALKNYLDAMDIESSRVLSLVESLSKKTLPVYKRLFG